MNLVVNFSMLGEHPTGLGRYAENCFDIVGFFGATVISSGLGCDGAKKVIQSPKDICIGAGRFSSLKRQKWLGQLEFMNESLIYSPTHHGLPHLNNQVITVHDLISLRFPRQNYLQYLFFRYSLPKLMRLCTAVFTVSETSRQDISRIYGYPLDRIFVVPNAVDGKIFQPGIVDKEKPYLLMVGARYPHKNIHEVLQMSAYWKGKYRLLITSCSGKYRDYLEREIIRLGLTGRVEFLDYIDLKELIALYQGCSALVYPSKWEGFGIPPLEAFACGRPVIASDIPVHREVLGEAALWVRLGDELSWKKAFSLLEMSDVIESKIYLGSIRVKDYSKGKVLDSLKSNLYEVCPNLQGWNFY